MTDGNHSTEQPDSTNDDHRTTRRRVLRGGTLAALLAAIGIAGVRVGTQHAVAAAFTARDVELTTHDGTLDRVTVAPDVTVSWTGLDAPADTATITLATRGTDSWVTAAEQTVPSDGYAGTTTVEFDVVDLTDTAAFTDADFAAPAGSTKQTDVELRVDATISAGEHDYSTSTGDAFVVTVNNFAAAADATGTANTGADSDTNVDGEDDEEGDGEDDGHPDHGDDHPGNGNGNGNGHNDD